jgi:hypothetical protein
LTGVVDECDEALPSESSREEKLMIVHNFLEARKSRNDYGPFLVHQSEQHGADATVRDDNARGARQFS